MTIQPTTATSTGSTRTRLGYAVATIAVIALGLASRESHVLFRIFGKYPGDALWALMLYCGLGVLRPTTRIGPRAVAAILIAFMVEFSQLWHVPWLDSIRATMAGHLVLGSTFNAPDLLAYAIGVAAGYAVDRAIR